MAVGSSSKNKMSERDNAIIRCYEISGDLTLLFLQVADRYVIMFVTKKVVYVCVNIYFGVTSCLGPKKQVFFPKSTYWIEIIVLLDMDNLITGQLSLLFF